MKVVTFKYILLKGYRAITFAPLVFVRSDEDKEDRTLIRHESIHIRQQYETLWIPFFIWYIMEYLFRLIQYRRADLAYRNVSFEREAYANQYRENYLSVRKTWAFTKYLYLKKQSI